MVHKPLPAPQVPAAGARLGKDQIRAAFSLTSFAHSPDGWPWLEMRQRGGWALLRALQPSLCPQAKLVPSLPCRALMPKSLSLPELIPVPKKAAGSSVLAQPGSHPTSGITRLLPSPPGSPLVSPWPEASGQSRNPAHGQLAAGRSFTNPVAPEETDNLFRLQPSAAKDCDPAELVQSQGSVL